MSLILNNCPIDKIIFSPICNAPTYIVTFIAPKQKAEKQFLHQNFSVDDIYVVISVTQ